MYPNNGDLLDTISEPLRLISGVRASHIAEGTGSGRCNSRVFDRSE
jgi:hypothetical protein